MCEVCEQSAAADRIAEAARDVLRGRRIQSGTVKEILKKVIRELFICSDTESKINLNAFREYIGICIDNPPVIVSPALESRVEKLEKDYAQLMHRLEYVTFNETKQS